QPSAPQPSAPAPPSGAVGGLPGLPEEAPGGAPITSPAPYPDQEQRQEQRQEQQDERKEASRQRGEVTPSAGDASTLQFSAYHPNTLPVGVWQTLIVYTYLAEALAQIQADVATFTELGSAPTVASGQASRQVEKGVELTVEPHMEGVTFSPERESFVWRGDWRRTLFRFSGAADLAGREQRGWIDIYAGPMVPVARIDLTFPFHDDHGRQLAMEPPRGMIVSSNIYDVAFISYSHRDGEAFRQACDEYARFGVTVYTDQQLEAGAHWEQELRQRIAESNVFHLLWSEHSAASVECRKEWMIALQREASERFIKPWFWRKPLSAPPAEFVQHRISFKYEPLRRSLWRPSTWFA
ncbi:MAG TPA: toll/interleukin-1 receptor domain-containing protein, partial [Ktedonobacterales bacterium]